VAQASRSEITVLGAGVAGLSVAIALARAGHGVTVLERAEEIREVGAGLQISPNGMRVLSALGLDPDAQNRAMLSQGVVLRDHFNGAEIARLKLPQDPGTRMMHRADLIDMLAEGARAVGVQLRLLHQIDSVEIEGDGTPQLRLVTGGVLRPDILIGADGLHSPTRRAILGPRAEKPKFTGQVAWRAIVPGRSGDPVEASVYMGPHRHLVSYPLRGGAVRNIVAVEERTSWTEEGWNHSDDPTRMQRAFSGFAPEVRGWLGEAREVFLWGLYRHEVPDLWHRGRAVIMGDAVHPTLPFLAQGANMALEDAWVLARCLDANETPEAAFSAYQTARIARVRKIVAAANTNAWVYHLPPGITRSVVHAGLKLGNRFAPDRALKRFDWVYDEDVTRS
jgi:salicylate hydroxylase